MYACACAQKGKADAAPLTGALAAPASTGSAWAKAETIFGCAQGRQAQGRSSGGGRCAAPGDSRAPLTGAGQPCRHDRLCSALGLSLRGDETGRSRAAGQGGLARGSVLPRGAGSWQPCHSPRAGLGACNWWKVGADLLLHFSAAGQLCGLPVMGAALFYSLGYCQGQGWACLPAAH